MTTGARPRLSQRSSARSWPTTTVSRRTRLEPTERSARRRPSTRAATSSGVPSPSTTPSPAPPRARGTRPAPGRGTRRRPARTGRRSADDPRFGDVVGEVEHDRRRRARRRPPAQSLKPLDLVDAEPARRRPGTRASTACTDRTPRPRPVRARAGSPRRRAAPVGEHQQQLGPRVERASACSNTRAELGAGLRVAGLERDDDLAPVARKRRREPFDLRALPDSLAALETMNRPGVALMRRRLGRLRPCACAGARARPERTVISAADHSARRTPGRLQVHGPDRAPTPSTESHSTSCRARSRRTARSSARAAGTARTTV